MATFARHMAAAVLLSLSVIALAVNWRFSRERDYENQCYFAFGATTLWCKWQSGEVQVACVDGAPPIRDSKDPAGGEIFAQRLLPHQRDAIRQRHARQGRFGSTESGLYFPFWYPSLAFACVAIGVFNLDRQVTIRSAMAATAVAAGLVAMFPAM
jgi:hypothetical protein